MRMVMLCFGVGYSLVTSGLQGGVLTGPAGAGRQAALGSEGAEACSLGRKPQERSNRNPRAPKGRRQRTVAGAYDFIGLRFPFCGVSDLQPPNCRRPFGALEIYSASVPGARAPGYMPWRLRRRLLRSPKVS